MARSFARTATNAGQYIDCGNSSTLNPANNASWGCWVRFDTFPTDTTGSFGAGYTAQFLIARDDGNTQRSYSILLQDYQSTRNTFLAAVFKNSSTASEAQGTTVAAINTWYHVFATYEFVADGTSILRLYVNGVQERATTNAVGPIVSSTATNSIARRTNASTMFSLNGRMAEAAIYNVTLTASEVAALATGASPRLVRPQGLVMYAPLVRDLIDVRGIATLTNSNSTVADHPRVYL